MPEIKPPLQYDQLKGRTVTDRDWRSKIKDDRWKDRLAETLDRVSDSISPNTHAVIEGFIERLLKDRT